MQYLLILWYGYGYGKAVPCEVLGLQQEPFSFKWIYLSRLLFRVGRVFGGANKIAAPSL